jgi:hypothetical protein
MNMTVTQMMTAPPAITIMISTVTQFIIMHFQAVRTAQMNSAMPHGIATLPDSTRGLMFSGPMGSRCTWRPYFDVSQLTYTVGPKTQPIGLC